MAFGPGYSKKPLRDDRGRFLPKNKPGDEQLVGVGAGFVFSPRRLQKAVDREAFRNLGHAISSIRKDAAASIQSADGASAPGSPPHTHRGAFLKKALRFHTDFAAMVAVAGPRRSVVGPAGQAHEFGGRHRGTNLAARPYMEPALQRAIPRFAGSWAGRVGS